jgi:hypothetical protein
MNWRSSGVAMLLAIVSGSRRDNRPSPGSRIVDRRQIVYGELEVSHHPEEDHGKSQTAVITGRRMNGSERFMFDPPASLWPDLAGACWDCEPLNPGVTAELAVENHLFTRSRRRFGTTTSSP